MWERLFRLVRAATGDDGTGGMWHRLSPDGREVIRLAFVESREFGHPCLADEHLLLGLLRHGTSPAATLLRSRGLDLVAARAELERLDPTLGPQVSPAGALRTVVGIDIAEVRQRLEATFGAQALVRAERRVRRRPRWRGGHPRPNPLCVYLLSKRSWEIAARFAHRHGDAAVTPEHLLYGAVCNARDPLGTQLSRRTRRELAVLGWTPHRPNPLRLLLEARGIDLTGLAAALDRSGDRLH
ncbi:Clp protease N-terminal domain-containing protein [Actinophytocola sp. NPDC049390]|uniref:Clp protease N-terminal domain-containing protein n=1 Tax=Actinophytocola sp. NPDC049390 TaxID=3363894 RepID=UPI0037AE455A